jgi:hypothetical protein
MAFGPGARILVFAVVQLRRREILADFDMGRDSVGGFEGLMNLVRIELRVGL